MRWFEERRDDWALDNGLSVHQWWHLALFHLESLSLPDALALYDAFIGGDASIVNLQWLDAAAMLWRLQLLGADVGRRWKALAAAWMQPLAHAGYYAFNDAHALMAMLGSGDATGADELLIAVRSHAAGEVAGAPDAPDNRAMALEVGLPLMQGLIEYSRGRPQRCIDALWPLRGIAHHFGGSHAQRDLIDQTLLAAAAAARNRGVGRALLNERRCAKPETPLTAFWASRLGAGSGKN